MVNTKIVLTLDGPLTEQERTDLRYLLTDAFWEFTEARKGNYVERRYPTMPEEFKGKMVEQVERRVTLAHKLHHATFQMAIVEEEL